MITQILNYTNKKAPIFVLFYNKYYFFNQISKKIVPCV